jgi:hypothetical protein
MMEKTLRQRLSSLFFPYLHNMSSSNIRRGVSGLVPLIGVTVFIAVIVALFWFTASHLSATVQHAAPAVMAPEHSDWKGVIALVLRAILQPTGL